MRFRDRTKLFWHRDVLVDNHVTVGYHVCVINKGFSKEATVCSLSTRTGVVLVAVLLKEISRLAKERLEKKCFE